MTASSVARTQLLLGGCCCSLPLLIGRDPDRLYTISTRYAAHLCVCGPSEGALFLFFFPSRLASITNYLVAVSRQLVFSIWKAATIYMAQHPDSSTHSKIFMPEILFLL